MLTIQNCSATIAGKRILHSISYTFHEQKTYVIMGPNGSGKSTFAHIIMGNPTYSVSKKTDIILDSESLASLSADKRAQKGLGLTFQNPLPLPGITVFQLLRITKQEVDVLKLKKEIETYAKVLHISSDLLKRPLHEGASGGERKKLEVLQMAVLKPKYIFFDEIDTGVDIDSLKLIFTFLKRIQKDKTYIFITHYKKILSYIKPYKVLIFNKGRIQKEGNIELVNKIEKKGYSSLH